MIYDDDDLDSDLQLAERLGYVDHSDERSIRTGVVTLKSPEVSLMFAPKDVPGSPTPNRGWYFWIKRGRLDVLPGDDSSTIGPGAQWSDLAAYPTLLTAHYAAAAALGVLKARRQYRRGVLHGLGWAMLVIGAGVWFVL